MRQGLTGEGGLTFWQPLPSGVALAAWQRAVRDRSGSSLLGIIVAEDSRAWGFHILDACGDQVAQITKQLRGALRELHTTGGEYELELTTGISHRLRCLSLAAAVSVDLALKADKDYDPGYMP